ncbi:Uncharacterised protein [Burkholderia pseudomallei]|nr:hypothetical protein DP60_4002 [Burkholderia pseudomallei]AJX10974.1 hypothetical protein BBW_4574 [Burkholderia pseudomallei 1026b]CAJ2995005.1 Uncharacterised protein [Burkholderia pseudomallei]CAJ3130467.1 Uncharacterised protein [Burkholderia pseudomallei]CAJ3144135.1 Uncharacterised protein [Burkholderia pseudomallei]
MRAAFFAFVGCRLIGAPLACAMRAWASGAKKVDFTVARIAAFRRRPNAIPTAARAFAASRDAARCVAAVFPAGARCRMRGGGSGAASNGPRVQGSKDPRIQGAASMSAAVNRESHAFRPAGAAPSRRRSGTAHGLMHQPSTCVACRETMAGAEYCTCRLRSVASRSPRRRGRIRNVLCDGRRRGRSAAFAARRSLLARRSIMRAAAADPDAHTRPTDLHVRSDRRIVLREIRALSRVLGRARARAASARARRTARRWIGARATGGSSRFRSARRARRPLPGSSALRRQSAASPRAVFQAAIRRRE